MANWKEEILTLNERVRIYQQMIKLEEKVNELRNRFQELSAPYGMLAVGTQHLEFWWEAECILEFLSELRIGHDLIIAKQNTRKFGMEMMHKHNLNREYDKCRWDGHCDNIIETIYSSFLVCLI